MNGSSVNAEQWSRIKHHLADLAELPGSLRLAAIEAADLAEPDRELLRRLAAGLPEAGPDTTVPQPTHSHRAFSLLRWQAGERVAGYRIEGLLGRGGMGEVYSARRVEDGQGVAIKVLRQGMDGAGFHHFAINEQRALQRLDDARIARFIEAIPLPDQSLALVLEQVSGEPIDAWCAHHRASTDQRLALFVSLCQTVAFAHRQLVVHRDLKPANVLVDEQGTLRILDFGIAKLLDDEGATTLTHGGLYTLEYAAPEQVLRNPVSTATDVYALGVLLFRLLAGASPYAVPAHESLVKAVLRDGPRSLSSLVPEARFDRDLDRVIQRAMEKEPRDRYGSAADLARDVQAIRDGAAISASGSSAYRLGKFVRRHPAGMAVSAVLALSLSGATLFSLHYARRAAADAAVAAQASEQSRAVSQFLIGLFQVSDPGVNRGDRLTANEILDRGAAALNADFAGSATQRAHLQRVVGEVYLSMGEYARAAAVLKPAAESMPSDPGNAAEAAVLRRLLATALARQAASVEALVELERADQLLGLSSDQDGQRVRIDLQRSRVLQDLGRLDEAGAALDRAEQGAALMPRLDGELLASIHATRGDLAEENGDFDRARGEYALALAQYADSIGDDHYRTVAVRTNLASLLVTRFHALDEAEPLLVKALAQWRRLRGADSAAYASTANTLGELFRRREEHVRAAELFADSERAYLIALGERHPSRAWPIRNLAKSLNDQGRYEEALTQFQRALDLVRIGNPDADVAIAQVQKQVVDTLIPIGRYVEARALGQEVLAVYRARFPADHAETVNTLYQIGFACHGAGDAACAGAFFAEARERAPRAFAHLPSALATMQRELDDPDSVLRGYAERRQRMPR